MSSYDLLLKIVIVGDSNVGKSCLVLQFTGHRFQNFHDPTIGVELQQKLVNYEGKVLKLQLWDTVGQENFLSIARTYYRESAGCVVTFDITNRESFTAVTMWANEVRANTGPELALVLVGTKADLAYKREVLQAEAEKLAASLSIPYVEVSAKEATNVTQPFVLICKEVLRNLESGRYNLRDDRCVVKSGQKEIVEMRSSMRVKLRPTEKNRKCGC